jgi:TetR/AcrR family transcriptional regulator
VLTPSDTEIKIIDAAKKVFKASGFAGTRMQQIADEAGISKASLHYYFRSKEKLFDLIFDQTMAEFMPLISTWEEDSTAWEQKLGLFIIDFFKFLQDKSMLFIIQEINRNPELLMKRKRNNGHTKNRFIAYFEKLHQAGKINDIDPKLIFIFLHSLCVYPILNAELFKMNTDMQDEVYKDFMSTYPEKVTRFLIETLKK